MGRPGALPTWHLLAARSRNILGGQFVSVVTPYAPAKRDYYRKPAGRGLFRSTLVAPDDRVVRKAQRRSAAPIFIGHARGRSRKRVIMEGKLSHGLASTFTRHQGYFRAREPSPLPVLKNWRQAS